MSLERLNRAIAELPSGRWSVGDLGALRAAAGERVNAEEQQRFAELLSKKWERFSEPARRALEVIAGHAAPDVAPTQLRAAGRYETNVREQSALAFVSAAHGFLLIDDESSKVWRLPFPAPGHGSALEATALRRDDRKLTNLEGIAWDPHARAALTVNERSGEVHELRAEEADDGALRLGAPRRLGALEPLGHTRNKGWEGLAVLPASLTADRRARLVAVHEGDPAAIGVFDRKTLRREALLELPVGMDPRDLSDLTLDPRTGRFFVLSDESRALWEVELRHRTERLGAGPSASSWALVPIHETKLPGDALKPEGVAVDHRGDVWVSFEESSALLRLERVGER